MVVVSDESDTTYINTSTEIMHLLSTKNKKSEIKKMIMTDTRQAVNYGLEKRERCWNRNVKNGREMDGK